MLHGGPQAATRRTASTPRQEGLHPPRKGAASDECTPQKESTGADLSQNGYGEISLSLSLYVLRLRFSPDPCRLRRLKATLYLARRCSLPPQTLPPSLFFSCAIRLRVLICPLNTVDYNAQASTGGAFTQAQSLQFCTVPACTPTAWPRNCEPQLDSHRTCGAPDGRCSSP